MCGWSRQGGCDAGGGGGGRDGCRTEGATAFPACVPTVAELDVQVVTSGWVGVKRPELQAATDLCGRGMR
jgi:hypothetical protein